MGDKMYYIKEVAKMAGITTRTLRHYDEIGLLKAKKSSNQYRIYDEKDIDKLQQICIYKMFGLSLLDIKKVLNKEQKEVDLLTEHLKNLEKEKQRIQTLIQTIKKTIKYHKGENQMTNQEKFIGLKEEMIKDNETLYGSELKEKYDQEEISSSYQKIRKMSKYQFDEAKKLEKQIINQLEIAIQTADVKSNEARKLCEMHQRWIKMYWETYDEKKHLGLVDLYVSDDRFKAYYEVAGHDAAIFLRDAMYSFLSA